MIHTKDKLATKCKRGGREREKEKDREGFMQFLCVNLLTTVRKSREINKKKGDGFVNHKEKRAYPNKID